MLVRVRPSPDGGASSPCLSLQPEKQQVSVSRDKKGTSDFAFSQGAILGPATGQEEVFSHCNVVDDVVNGLNCCVMAYGQTSSGKTHTMYGHSWDDTQVSPDADGSEGLISGVEGSDLGVVPRTIDQLFATLDAKAAQNEDWASSVTCQVLQIYNERIYDLLGDKKRENALQIREVTRRGKTRSSDFASVHVPGLSAFRVHTREDVHTLIQKGMRNRAVRATDFNAESSRSHTILQLFVETEAPDEQGLIVLKRSVFSLVDLAGSEKWRPSLDNNGNTNRLHAESLRRQEQEKEMVNINASLATLGNVVSALLEPGRKHIPFRDSALTRLLQDPLGGHGRTIIIATIHEAAMYQEETFSTLTFANRASRIKVSLHVTEGVSEGITLDGAKRQIRLLRARVQELSTLVGQLPSQASAAEADQELLTKGKKSTCTVCHELVNRFRDLLHENMQLRAHVAPGGDFPKANSEKRGLIQAMLEPLGLYRSPEKAESKSTTSTLREYNDATIPTYDWTPGEAKPAAPVKAIGPIEEGAQSPKRGIMHSKQQQLYQMGSPKHHAHQKAQPTQSPKGQHKKQHVHHVHHIQQVVEQKNSPQPRTADSALVAARLALDQSEPSANSSTSKPHVDHHQQHYIPGVYTSSTEYHSASFVAAHPHGLSSPNKVSASPNHGLRQPQQKFIHQANPQSQQQINMHQVLESRNPVTSPITSIEGSLQENAPIRQSIASATVSRYCPDSPASVASGRTGVSSLTASMVSLTGSVTNHNASVRQESVNGSVDLSDNIQAAQTSDTAEISDVSLAVFQEKVSKATLGFQMRLTSDLTEGKRMIEAEGLQDKVAATENSQGHIIIVRKKKSEKVSGLSSSGPQGTEIGSIKQSNTSESYDARRIELKIQESERALGAAQDATRISYDAFPVNNQDGSTGADIGTSYNSFRSSYENTENNSNKFDHSSNEVASFQHYDATAQPASGVCAKHGLDQCILCLMFNESKPRASMRSSYDFGAGSPSSSNLKSSSRYSYNNIGSMGDINPTVNALQGSLGIQGSVDSITGAPSPTFGRFQRPPSTGMSCQAHGVRDCLLCSLNQRGPAISGYSSQHTTLAPVKVNSQSYGLNSQHHRQQEQPQQKYQNQEKKQYAQSHGGERVEAAMAALHSLERESPAQQTSPKAYGMYQAQSDSSDDTKYNNYKEHLQSPRATQQHARSRAHDFETGGSNIRFEDDDGNGEEFAYQSTLRDEGDDEERKYEDRYVPSAPYPASANQTRGHSVPSSTASSLYSPPQTGENYRAPVEAYVQNNIAPQRVGKKKSRQPALSAKPRLQQSTIHRKIVDSDAGQEGGLSNYLYDADTGSSNINSGAQQQQKLTRRTSGASLPQLPSVRMATKKTIAAGGGTKKSSTSKKKAVRGAPQLGGLATRRK